MKLSILFAAVTLLLPLTPAIAEDTLEVSEFTFTYGEPWIRQQTISPMRAAQLTYKQEDDSLEDIDVVFYYFGMGQGGGVQANLNRWIGQFEGTPEKTIEEKEINGRSIILLNASGTFLESIGGPMSKNKTPRPGYTMLAAILPSDKGAVFLKLTGPSASVEVMEEAFETLATSALTE